MNTLFRTALAAAALGFAAQAAADITFYGREGFEGRALTMNSSLEYFSDASFGNRASSVVVTGNTWEVCDDVRFSGRCMILRPGRYPSLASMGMDNSISSARIVGPGYAGRYAPAPAAAEIVLYEDEDFRGRSFAASGTIPNLRGTGFNNRAASVEVRGQWFEVCDDAGFSGHCVSLRPGRYPSLAAMGMRNSITSVRTADLERMGDNRYRRRGGEPLYQANVVSVRAVVGPPEQRCWVEREQVRGSGVGGAIAGALIGGILGHQIGSGSGRDVATVGGAVAGAAIGSNVTRERGGSYDVQRCNTVPSAAPAYWDVIYSFRGQDHRVQMASPPGPTIQVNEQGEPRV
jgi:uncharacterized protein YcfJ